MTIPASDQLSTALESVVESFAAMVRRVAWRHRLSDADVDEVLQEVRIRLWKAHARGEQIERIPTSYVYRTAVSAALDLMRRRRGQREELTVPLDTPEGDIPAMGNPDTDVAGAELARQVASAIETIPASRRPVVRMYLAGYPREEIATLLGWSEAKTRNLLYRGLADLRAKLVAAGIGLETDG